MSKSQQRKGRAGEIALCKLLNEHGIPCRPGRAQSFGTEPDICDLPYIHPEVKRTERLDLSKAMTQSIRDSERFKDGMPAVFHRRSRSEWLVTMPLSAWLEIYTGFIRDKQK